MPKGIYKRIKIRSGWKLSEDVRKKISERLKGHPSYITKEGIEKMRKSKLGCVPWNKGIKGYSTSCKGGKLSEAHKKKLSESHKGQISWNKGKKMPEISGEKNPLWKGDDVGYRALHHWIINNLGTPAKCEDCGKNNLVGHKIHWANISGKYKRDLTDWKRLCVKCHSKFDKRYGNISN